MKFFYILTALFLLLPLRTFGEDYQNYGFQFFFGRQPSARSEAMGRTMVASNDGAFTAFYNPAATYMNKGLNVAFSHGGPFYLLDNARYLFGGATYNTGKWGTVGLHYHRFSWGDELIISTAASPQGYESFKPFLQMLALNYAIEIYNGFAMGINLNWFSDHYFKKNQDSFPVDAGVFKRFQIRKTANSDQTLNFGFNAQNIFSSNINYKALTIGTQKLNFKEALPVILSGGASYNFSFLKQDFLPDLFVIGITLQGEYQNVLNYGYRTGYHFGSEFSLFELFAVRLGYYSFNNRTSPESNSKKRVSDLTYGFGMNLPFNHMFRSNIPFTVSFDFTSLQQPTYITNYDNWENFTVFSLNMEWDIK
ncbi:MAG: hypothetical protein WAN36_16295 [Calditrichia bacterium]